MSSSFAFTGREYARQLFALEYHKQRPDSHDFTARQSSDLCSACHSQAVPRPIVRSVTFPQSCYGRDLLSCARRSFFCNKRLLLLRQAHLSVESSRLRPLLSFYRIGAVPHQAFFCHVLYARLTRPDLFGLIQNTLPILERGEGNAFSFAICDEVVPSLCEQQIGLSSCG